MSNLDIIYNYLRKQGFSQNAAYGVIGNIKAESGGSTSVLGDGGTSGGICQWHLGRFDNLKAFAAQRGKPWTNLGVQLDFMMHELKTGYPGLLNLLQNSTNMERVAREWMTTYERPADQSEAAQMRRVGYADDARQAGIGGDGAGDGGAQRTDGDGGGGGGGDGGNKLTASDFGFLKEFLDKHPDVAKLIDKAINQEWSETRFMAEVKQTKWWEKNTAAERAWTRLIVEDPAQAERDQELARDRIQLIARNMGVQLDKQQLDNMALRAVKNDLQDFEVQAMIGARFRMPKKEGQAVTGEAAVTVDQLRVMADEYGVGLGQRALTKWTKNILQGELTVEGYEDKLRQKAMLRYKGIADDLKRGFTVREVYDDYAQLAQSMLGVTTEQMDLRDPRWAKALNGGDKGEAMSLDEWATTLKTDPRYGYNNTSQAKSEASEMILNLGKLMGMVG